MEKSAEIKENIIVAINSAMSVLSLILEQPDLRSALVGVHNYFHAMIAYSAMFLLKALMQFPSVLHVEAAQVIELVDQVMVAVKGSKSTEQHLTTHIADGLEKLLIYCKYQSLQYSSPQQDGNDLYPFPFLEPGTPLGKSAPSLWIVAWARFSRAICQDSRRRSHWKF